MINNINVKLKEGRRDIRKRVDRAMAEVTTSIRTPISLNAGTIEAAPADRYMKYNFYSTSIGGNMDIINTTDSFIEISKYNYLDKFPHVTHNLYDGKEDSFVISSIRVYKPAHRFARTYNGELVLECISPESSKYTYVVIPLSTTTSATASNNIDSLIQSTSSNLTITPPARLHLNNLIPVETGGGYLDANELLKGLSYSVDTEYSLFSTSESVDVDPVVVVLNLAIPINASTATRIGLLTNTLFGSGTNAGGKRITAINNGIHVHSSSAASSNDIYVDCRPDDEEEEEASADKRFRLSEKDIADICIAILITLFWSTAWAILNEYFKTNPPEMFQNFAAVMGATIPIDRLGVNLPVGSTILLTLVILMLLLFLSSFSARKIGLFKAAFYVMTIVFDFVFCSRLAIFQRGSKNKNPSVVPGSSTETTMESLKSA
jgi:hypothetical protein